MKKEKLVQAELYISKNGKVKGKFEVSDTFRKLMALVEKDPDEMNDRFQKIADTFFEEVTKIHNEVVEDVINEVFNKLSSIDFDKLKEELLNESKKDDDEN